MKTLLVVEVSPRLELSVPRSLTTRFVEQWKKGNPHGVVVVRDLFKSHILFVDLHWIGKGVHSTGAALFGQSLSIQTG